MGKRNPGEAVTTKQGNRVKQGHFQRERKDEKRAKGGGGTWGEGEADVGETEGNYST